jgi:hypothetical protein
MNAPNPNVRRCPAGVEVSVIDATTAPVPAASAAEPIQYLGVLLANPLRSDSASSRVGAVSSVGAVDVLRGASCVLHRKVPLNSIGRMANLSLGAAVDWGAGQVLRRPASDVVVVMEVVVRLRRIPIAQARWGRAGDRQRAV